MLDCLDRHRRSRPGGTGSSDPVGAERMCSAENEGPGASPADRAPIPEHTTHHISSLPERVLMRIERKLDPELPLRNRGTQTVLLRRGLTR